MGSKTTKSLVLTYHSMSFLPLKKTIIILTLVTTNLTVGAFIGWWANSPSFDFLCSSPAVYELGKDLAAEGISIKAGTQVSMKSCEYANRFNIELYSEKGNYPQVFIPLNSAVNIGNHGVEQYHVTFSE